MWSLRFGWPTRAIRSLGLVAGVEEIRLGRGQRLEASSTPNDADGRHDPLEDLDRVILGLSWVTPGKQVALLGRAEDHQAPPEVARRLGEGDQVVAGPAADGLVGGGQVKPLGLGQQPVEADRVQAGVLDDRLQLARGARVTSMIRGRG